MKTENYILVNNRPFKLGASLKDLRIIMAKLHCVLGKVYTFRTKTRLRRVIKLVSKGVIYSVYSRGIPYTYYANGQSSECLYFGFDAKKGYGTKGELRMYDAKEMNFSQKFILKTYFPDLLNEVQDLLNI